MRAAALDIGGANIKACGPGDVPLIRPFELWRSPGALEAELAAVLHALPHFDLLAVTMTGELCDCFETKEDGVRRILGAAEGARLRAAPRADLVVWRTDRRLVSLAEALEDPLPAAAANWLALACFAGRLAPRGTALLCDVGSTTTDIIPLRDGNPVPAGLTDTCRLLAGELVYTGASRTPVAAVVRDLPHRGRRCPVSSESFATTRDAHLLLGLAPEAPDDLATADGRPATRAFARDRLARMVCADRTAFGDDDALAAAAFIVEQQQATIRAAAEQVCRRFGGGPPEAILISGSGEALALRSLEGLGSRIISLAREIGPAASAAGPAHALARLAEEGPLPYNPPRLREPM